MIKIFKKLSSRKLWLALTGVTTGIAMILGADATEITTVMGGITSLISAVTYIVVEGKIDAKSIGNATTNFQNGIDIIKGED